MNYKVAMKYTLGELAEHVSGEVKGDASCKVDSIATLQNAKGSQISFFIDPSYRKQLASCQAGAVILSAKDAEDCPVNVIISSNPFVAYAKIAALLSPYEKYKAGIDEGAHVANDAVISESASIAAGAVIESGVVIADFVRIGPGCVVQHDVKIGLKTVLTANVTIAQGCVIGERTLIHPGVVIGSDGFGIAMDDGFWIKVPQLGNVQIGNDVEIGANTTIDRGTIEDTIIGNGVKLDNQIQIAHNVVIGEHTVISAATAIAGTTTIGNNCLIGGCVAIRDNIDITDNVVITGRTLVSKSLTKSGSYSSSTPIDDTLSWRKNSARFRSLDELARRVKKLESYLSSNVTSIKKTDSTNNKP